MLKSWGGYRFELLRLGQQAGPNYLAEQAVFEVTRDGPDHRWTGTRKAALLCQRSDHDRSRDRRKLVAGSLYRVG